MSHVVGDQVDECILYKNCGLEYYKINVDHYMVRLTSQTISKLNVSVKCIAQMTVKLTECGEHITLGLRLFQCF